MGCCLTRKKKGSKDFKSMAENLKMVRARISEMVKDREKERKAYEEETMGFAFKEAEWIVEKKRLKEEVKKLRRMVEDKEEKIKEIEEDGLVERKFEWESVGKMREEQTGRDEAARKWKQLYLAIKTELDHLIQETNGSGLFLKTGEDDVMEKLRKEVKAKEKRIQSLKDRVAYMENEEYKKEREIDILRQSLRIISSKKVSYVGKSSYHVFLQ